MLLIKNGYFDAITEKWELFDIASGNDEFIQSRMTEKLHHIMQYAHSNIPYYRDLINAEKGHKLDLNLFPILTKETIENQRERLINPKMQSCLEASFTGGSSGTPTSFYRDRFCTAKRIGRQAAILEAIGCPYGEKIALVWGAHQDIPRDQGRYRLKHKLHKWISGREILDASNLTDSSMEAFYKKIQATSIRILYGYPNALDEFASFIDRKGLKSLKFEKIYTTAERLKKNVRDKLEFNFGGQVYDLYCTREHGCIGFECNEHKGYHLDVSSVVVEIFENDKPVDTGQIGDIITTDLLNYGMPMIRYKIGDRGILSKETCNCGCKLPLLKKLHGRVSDCIYKTDGTPLSGLLLIDMFLGDTIIRQMQIIQEDYCEFTINIVAAEQFHEADRTRVIDEARKYIGNNAIVNINVLESLPVNQNSGKFPEIITKIGRAQR